MYKFSNHFLVSWLFVISISAIPIPNMKQNLVEQGEQLSELVIQDNNDMKEENGEEPPMFIMVPMIGERTRRGAYDDGNVLNFANVSYEVPTFIRFNESAKGDLQVSLVPGQGHVASESQSNRARCGEMGCPPKPCCPPQPPVSLTIQIENAFPASKCGKMCISNSSEIKGTGARLKINFVETKRPCGGSCSSDDNLEIGIAPKKESFQMLKKKKVDDQEEEEEEEDTTTQIVDQKMLQEIILKILTGNKTISSPTSASFQDEVVYIENSTIEPNMTILFNPSIINKVSGKNDSPVQKKITGSTTNRDPNAPADFDSILKTIEGITSSIPKDKLLSLFSNLINKATLNK